MVRNGRRTHTGEEGVMIVKAMGIRVCKELPIKKRVINQIIETIPDDEQDFRLNVDITVGEVLSNLKKYDDHRPARIHYFVNDKRLMVQFQSQSLLVNYELLSTCLEDSKKRLKAGKKTRSLEDEHGNGFGLGHDFIASLSTDSHYDPEGRLTILFDRNHLPSKDFSNLEISEH